MGPAKKQFWDLLWSTCTLKAKHTKRNFKLKAQKFHHLLLSWTPYFAKPKYTVVQTYKDLTCSSAIICDPFIGCHLTPGLPQFHEFLAWWTWQILDFKWLTFHLFLFQTCCSWQWATTSKTPWRRIWVCFRGWWAIWPLHLLKIVLNLAGVTFSVPLQDPFPWRLLFLRQTIVIWVAWLWIIQARNYKCIVVIFNM